MIFYRQGVLPTGERLVDLVDVLTQNNTYLTCTNGRTEYTPKEDKNLEDLGFFDPVRQKSQTLKAQKVVPVQKEKNVVGGINI